MATSMGSIDAWFVGDDLGEIYRAEYGDTRHTHLRPLLLVLLRANRAVGGLDPVGYHLVNLAFHAMAIGLVGWVASTLARRRGVEVRTRRRIATLAAIVFASLATHSEAVSWVSARGNLVVGCGALLTVGAWARRDEGRRWRWVAGAGLVVALAANESAVVIPFLCLLLSTADGAPTRRGLWEAAREVAPLVGVLGVYLAVRAMVIGRVLGSYQSSGAFNWHPVHFAGEFLVMLVRTLVPGVGRSGWVALAVLVTGLTALAWIGRARLRRVRRSPALGVACLTMVLLAVAVLPAAGLGVSRTDTRGERLLYLGSAFSAVAVAAALIAVVEAMTTHAWRRIAVVALGVVLVISAGTAVGRDERWKQAGDLTAATVRDGPMWTAPGHLVVINPADTLRGVYVHRNGLGEAGVIVHGWSNTGRVTDVALMALQDRTARVRVIRLHSRRWLLVPAEGAARFLPGPKGLRRWDRSGVTATLRSDGALQIRVRPEVDIRDLWYLSGGRFVRLDRAGGT